MKNVIIIILVALFSISATIAVQNVTFTPATPKIISVNGFDNKEKAVSFIMEKSKLGFILKSCTANGYHYNDGWIVIMEKY